MRACMVLCTATLLAGCTPTTTYLPLVNVQRPPRDSRDVEVYLDQEEPTRPHKTVGMFEADDDRPGGGHSRMVIRFRERAAREGLDGIIIQCGVPGSVGQWKCAGKGFIYEGAPEAPAKVEPDSRAPAPAASSAPMASGPVWSAPQKRQPESPPARRPLARYGTATLVVGSAGLAAGTVLGLLAMSAASEVHAHCDANRVCDGQGLDAVSRGPTLATTSTALFVGGGVLAAAGIVLLALPGTRVTASPAPQGLGLSLHGAF